MIAGYFSAHGVPYVKGQIFLPRLGVAGEVHFLVDTGSVATVLHSDDGVHLGCPFERLVLPVILEGVGSALTYYRETAIVTFDNNDTEVGLRIEISIAKPGSPSDGLDSLLGRDVLNRLRMEYDFPQGLLGFL